VSSRLVTEVPNSWKANQYDNLSNSQAHYEQTGAGNLGTNRRAASRISSSASARVARRRGSGGFSRSATRTSRYGVSTLTGSVFKKYKETGIFDKNEIYPYITEGIGEDFLPQNVDFSVIDHFEKVTDKDAR
jgi:cystathionine beta-synthase